jgi:hypothetical protein
MCVSYFHRNSAKSVHTAIENAALATFLIIQDKGHGYTSTIWPFWVKALFSETFKVSGNLVFLFDVNHCAV